MTKKIEFGDFQTPDNLAFQVASIVLKKFELAKTIIDPTCGLGNFLKAVGRLDLHNTNLCGWEINTNYVNAARNNLSEFKNKYNLDIKVQDFFDINLKNIGQDISSPILFIGNPPWVTNAELGVLGSKNLPPKSNFQGRSGFDAILGKSNFDISEWILIQIAEYISQKTSAMAFLVKTSVARKILLHICKNKLNIQNISIYKIDAKKHFNVSVDACLFYAEGENGIVQDYRCEVHDSLESVSTSQYIGYRDGHLIANVEIYEKLSDIDAGCEFRWRSGIKHDCSKVMELRKIDDHYFNGLSEEVSISEEYLYPMYKSSDIAKDILPEPKKYMIVTQKLVGEETNSIKYTSPSFWKYLDSHRVLLEKRKSSIYKGASRFAIFGVGDYSFQDWKIAISGLYKNLKFSLIEPYKGKPVVLDDTCYLLAFNNREKAQFVYDLLTSDISKAFIESIIFKDNKRPITVSLLKRISLRKLAQHLDRLEEYDSLFKDLKQIQKGLFEKAV